MQYSQVIEHEMDDFEQAAAGAVYEAIQNSANGTERSKQQQEFRLGASNIGHCQQAAVLMTRQTPPSDVRDKSAAFFGTIAGAAIEKQMKLDHPDWIFQAETVFRIPSGGELGAHPDIVIPFSASVSRDEFELNALERAAAKLRIEQGEDGVEVPDPVYVQGVWDLKSKDKLDIIKKYGPSKQQKYQLAIYVSSCIDEGLLNPDEPIWITDVYFDRSGSQHEAYSFGWWYDPDILTEIDDWIHDLKYAIVTGGEGSKDKPREWCWSYCEYATLCRGNDTDAEGLIEDPEILAAIRTYQEEAEKEKAAKKAKDVAKLHIPLEVKGSTGTHNARWVYRNPTVMKESMRAGYWMLDVRPIPGPKKPAARKRKPAKEVQEQA
ncbi:Cas4 family exonuclease [Arthrobacter phage BruhMoment]|nr:Cas4 family exonuclease [Arthrobacter phage BruhMoment]